MVLAHGIHRQHPDRGVQVNHATPLPGLQIERDLRRQAGVALGEIRGQVAVNSLDEIIAYNKEDLANRAPYGQDHLEETQASDLTDEEWEALRAEDSRKAIPPLYGALLKNEQDVHLFEQLVFLDRRSNPQ